MIASPPVYDDNKNIHNIDALKNGSMIIMGFLGKIGNAIQKIDYHISNDPEIVGKRFEDHVEKLFSTKYFKIVEKTHSFKTNTERYVDSSKNPDFIFEYMPTREKFAVECKYRTQLNKKKSIRMVISCTIKKVSGI
jgi:hypothetical protein